MPPEFSGFVLHYFKPWCIEKTLKGQKKKTNKKNKKKQDGGAWQATVRGITESQKMERLHFHFLFFSLTIWDFPGGTTGKEPTCQSSRHKRWNFDLWIN